MLVMSRVAASYCIQQGEKNSIISMNKAGNATNCTQETSFLPCGVVVQAANFPLRQALTLQTKMTGQNLEARACTVYHCTTVPL